MQLSVSQNFSEKDLTIVVPEIGGLPQAQLTFPELLCRDPEVFDATVEPMRRGAELGFTRKQVEARIEEVINGFYATLRSRIPPTVRTFGKEERDAVTDIGATYLVYDRVRREGRDSIWAYVARNLSRPLSFSAYGGGRTW